MANKTTVTVNNQFTLTPVFSGGAATVSGPGSSAPATSGVGIAVSFPAPQTTPYTLTVTNAAGDSATAQVNVTTVPAPSGVLLASPTSLPAGGGAVMITPSFGFGMSATLESSPTVSLSGSIQSGVGVPAFITSTTTFILTVTNPAGDTSRAYLTVPVN